LVGNKKVTFTLTYHNDEMSTISKNEKEIIKPKVAFDYNSTIWWGGGGAVDLKDHMLQTYLLACKKGNKWYIKFFKRLLSVTIHNTMVLFRATPGNKKLYHLNFRFTLIKGFIESRGQQYQGLRMVALLFSLHQKGF
jgi:hypothetical protein